jgi:hypothetical protein
MSDVVVQEGDMVRVPVGCRVHRVSPPTGKTRSRTWRAREAFLVTVMAVEEKKRPPRMFSRPPAVVHWKNRKGCFFCAYVDEVQVVSPLELLALARRSHG